jgi:hypothetical protein
MAEAHEIMHHNPDLGTTSQNAIHQVDGDGPKGHFMAPLNHEMYYQSHVGQDTSHHRDDEPMGLNFHKNRESTSEKASDSESDRSEIRSQTSGNGSGDENPDSGSDSDPDDDNQCHYHSEDEDL